MLSCSHAVKPVSLSVRQKSLFALLLSLISSDCLRRDCQPIHKAPASTWGAVLLTAPQDFIHILEVLKELLDLVMGVFKLYTRPLSC